MSLKITQIAQLAILLGAIPSQAQQTTVPAPISLPPSQYWEGDDGEWSSFSLRLGNPPQPVRVLVSTQFPNTVVKINSTCPEGNDSTCANGMGKLFSPNSSTSYQDQGIFNLYPELNYTTQYDRAQYGFDSLAFGLNDADGNNPWPRQIIAATNSPNYNLGLFGANPQPTNFTDFTNPIPSLFQSLKDNNTIPSKSYSYTAGSPYRFKKVLGSFVFGGYDASRIELNDIDFTMADDVSRDLQVGVQSIVATQNDGLRRDLLNDGILALVDTTTPYIVLPPDACDSFANTLGLEWDPQLSLYTVSNAVHNRLTSSGLNLSFQLGNLRNTGPSVNINLPYDAFDLTMNSDKTNNTETKYFPILPGNDTQYTIGRAFFQEAMLIANYEQGNFSISQCVWNEDAKEQIEIIRPKGYIWPASAEGASGNGTDASAGQGSSAAAIGGGVGGAIGGVVVLALILFFCRRNKWWPFHKTRTAELDSKPVTFLADGTALDAQGNPIRDYHEAETKGFYGQEMPGSDGAIVKSELPGSQGAQGRGKNELAGGAVWRPGDQNSRGELRGDDGAREALGDEYAREMQGSGIVMELAAEPVSEDYLMTQHENTSRSRGSAAGSRATTPRRGTMNNNSIGSSPRSRSPRSSPRSPLIERGSPARGSSGAGPSPLGDGTSPGPISGTSTNFVTSPMSADSERRGSGNSRGRPTRQQDSNFF